MNLRDATSLLLGGNGGQEEGEEGGNGNGNGGDADNAAGSRQEDIVDTEEDIVDVVDPPAAAAAAAIVTEIAVSPDLEEEDEEDLRRFVDALEGHGAAVHHVRFAYARFRGSPDADDASQANNVVADSYVKLVTLKGNDTERLFGSVLPNLPSLRTLQFGVCEISTHLLRTCLAALTATAAATRAAPAEAETAEAAPVGGVGDAPVPAIATSDAYSLIFNHCFFDSQGFGAIASALRGNVRLESLHIDNCAMNAAECRLVCDAAAKNRHLVDLFLRDSVSSGAAFADVWCLRGVLGARSSVRRLHLEAGSFPRSFPEEVARLLSTNVVLESLTVAANYQSFLGEGAERLLQSHNFTLRRVVQRFTGRRPDPHMRLARSDQERVDRLLSRNERMVEDHKRAVAAATATGPATGPATGATGPHPTFVRRLLPEAIQRFGAFPTLIYRFLRPHGDALAEALAGGAGGGGGVGGGCSSAGRKRGGPVRPVPP